MPRIQEGFKGERMVVLPAYLIEQLRHDPLGLELYITDIGYSFIGATANTQLAKAEHGLGKTFPGVATPWGMTQVSPNTITGGDNGAGYSYEHTTIEGFALTQMSGIGWYGDLGNFLVMPTTGDLHTWRGTEDAPEKGYRSRYDKQSETAHAGYYAVRLTDYGVQAELTLCPGETRYELTAPVFSRVEITLDKRYAKGRRFVITASRNQPSDC